MVKTKGTAKGDFATGYHVSTETDITGAPYAGMNGHHAMELDSKYLGPCPAGMAPGAVAFGNGMSVDPAQLRAAAQAFRNPP